ncbi:D-glycero-beta-D-manno-heptose 1-phosphate adenylyltransferase [Pontibacter sp. G13]|uniref:D-glycero-beta-D-manno-heptose 1-phosphate adenylyltransferase n=1 Tax=Pontibacter sp. G13 TaxID=3074898 RepID=UPI00288B1EDD|nr:D-glycero-beta-D-manno-heptose 1-phosphate adenylyltransferase [Pontibacter sp. G13]WNJ16273.1 D-glycero-beta-D-manno-heptose 1-phosphate adenylyltransferase [Pontibacter sp. G13]
MYQTRDKILDLAQLTERIHAWRVTGESIVFTNGCFDLLHLGHIDYLEKARQLGNRLVVGLNADLSVRRLKGEARPVNGQTSRARMLAALGFVDAVTVFYEDTPYNLIQHVEPDVLVKGADYEVHEIVGHDIVQARGGFVHRIKFLEGYSTSNLIEKLKLDIPAALEDDAPTGNTPQTT